MKFRWDNRYLHWGVTAFLVIAASTPEGLYGRGAVGVPALRTDRVLYAGEGPEGPLPRRVRRQDRRGAQRAAGIAGCARAAAGR